MNIKFAKPDILKKDIKNVEKILKSGWLTHGQTTKNFEKEFRKFTNSKYSLTTSSCTSALHLACIGAGFKKNDEVIIPSMTHVATAHAVEYTGASVKIVDVDKLTGNLNLGIIKKNYSKKVKGIIIVHMSGIANEVKKILKFCKDNNIKLIEDCAHALGSYCNNKHVGNFGLAGCFSFYPTKQITTGEGGMLITNNKSFFDRVKNLKAFGISKDISERKIPGDYDVNSIGYNYRMTEFQSSLGLDQIKRYKKNLFKRKIVAKRYIYNLKKNKQILYKKYSQDFSYFVFQIFVNNRNEVISELNKNKIGFSIHYLNPLHNLSYYKKRYSLKKVNFKNTEIYAKKNISLPVYKSLTLKEVDIISKLIINIAR
jgi:perosamine synthetase